MIGEILLSPTILPIIIQATQKYETSFSVFKSITWTSNANVQTNRLLILIYYVICYNSVILYKLLYRKRLLVEVYTKFNVQGLPYWTICVLEFWKSLEAKFRFWCYAYWTCMSVTQKGIICLNLWKLWRNRKGFQIYLKTY